MMCIDFYTNPKSFFNMKCLGIESTAHTFGAGIVDEKGNVLANEKKSYTTKKGGMIPAKTAEHHIEVCELVIKRALQVAKLNIRDIDVISFSKSPGIGHTLRIGANMARALSIRHNKPLIGVNHCIAHLEIGHMLFNADNPVLLYASGANTQIIAYDNGRYRIFGETLDIGIGNFIDSLARELGLGFPGGPQLQELAMQGGNLIRLPYVVKGMDVSFGGLLTNIKAKISEGKYKYADIAYSAQETIFAMLMEVAERAMSHCNKNQLLLGGGVACNKRLQEMAKIMCNEREAVCFIPPNDLLVDNGAMIAWLGIIMYKNGYYDCLADSVIRPYERTDEVEINWRN